MARVADEAPHLLDGRVALRERLVEPIEHRVDRELEATDLGGRLDLGHALVEVALGDAHRGLLDLAEPTEREGDEPARAERADEQRDDRHRREHADVRADEVVRVVERQCDELCVEGARFDPVELDRCDRSAVLGSGVRLERERTILVQERVLHRQLGREDRVAGGPLVAAGDGFQMPVVVIDRDDVVESRLGRLRRERHRAGLRILGHVEDGLVHIGSRQLRCRGVDVATQQ